ncbi:MAG: hypothetical protein DRQ89_10420 [Epsilonproteobacteria bacterium]|nr:MAG: hypothetical protein DRQ89_10420 [Campylobacterota bacterium]
METTTHNPKSGPKPHNGQINVRSYPFNEENEYHLDMKIPWIKDLLKELEQDQMIDEDHAVSGSIEVKLSIQKKNTNTLKDHFILHGSVKAHYPCSCVKCLELTHESLENEFSCCFIDYELGNSPKFENSTYIDHGLDELELYTYDNGVINLKELIHENIYMVANPLPLHHIECKGLCPSCGVNLNLENCSHRPLKN